MKIKLKSRLSGRKTYLYCEVTVHERLAWVAVFALQMGFCFRIVLAGVPWPRSENSTQCTDGHSLPL